MASSIVMMDPPESAVSVCQEFRSQTVWTAQKRIGIASDHMPVTLSCPSSFELARAHVLSVIVHACLNIDSPQWPVQVPGPHTCEPLPEVLRHLSDPRYTPRMQADNSLCTGSTWLESDAAVHWRYTNCRHLHDTLVPSLPPWSPA